MTLLNRGDVVMYKETLGEICLGEITAIENEQVRVKGWQLVLDKLTALGLKYGIAPKPEELIMTKMDILPYDDIVSISQVKLIPYEGWLWYNDWLSNNMPNILYNVTLKAVSDEEKLRLLTQVKPKLKHPQSIEFVDAAIQMVMDEKKP